MNDLKLEHMKKLNELLQDCGTNVSFHDTEILQMVGDLVDKQIPKKPLLNDAQINLGKYMCECRCIVHIWDKYCPKCGQRMDWRKDE